MPNRIEQSFHLVKHSMYRDHAIRSFGLNGISNIYIKRWIEHRKQYLAKILHSKPSNKNGNDNKTIFVLFFCSFAYFRFAYLLKLNVTSIDLVNFVNILFIYFVKLMNFKYSWKWERADQMKVNSRQAHLTHTVH